MPVSIVPQYASKGPCSQKPEPFERACIFYAPPYPAPTSLELVTTQLCILRSQKGGLEIDCLTTVWLRRAPLSSVRAPGTLADAGI